MSNTVNWFKVQIKVKRDGPHGPHNPNTFERCSAWCIEQFGERWKTKNRKGDWYAVWEGPRYHLYYSFYFRNDKDAVIFALRWA